MRLMEQEFAELRGQLYPLMMDPVQIHEKGQGQIVHGEIAEGLHVIYGIEDSEEKIRYVTYQDLRDWGVSQTTIHVTAIQNLERKTARLRVTKLDSAQGGRPMFIWHVADGYDAARILLPKRLDEFAEAVPGRLVLGVPHRNWLLAVGDEDPELVLTVRRKVKAEHHSAGFPVSPFLYTWGGAGLGRYKA